MVHCQTTRYFHPRARSFRLFILSRAALPSIFVRQNVLRVAGIEARLHLLWPCQKQPWTKITRLCRGSTMSGRPGKRFSYRRNRYPMRRIIERTRLSGAEFFDPILRMISERSLLVKTSAITRQGTLITGDPQARSPTARHAESGKPEREETPPNAPMLGGTTWANPSRTFLRLP